MNFNYRIEESNLTPPQISPSFFDDKSLNEVYDFASLSRNLKLPENLSVLNHFVVVNLRNKRILTGEFGLFDHYITASTRLNENESLEYSLVIDVDKARVQRKKALKDGRFSFNLIKNGTIFQFISDQEGTIDTWIEALNLICLYTDYHEQYNTTKLIGTGSFSRIYLTEHRVTNIRLAVKAFNKDFQFSKMKETAKDALSNEINVMKVLTHKNIVQLYEIYETENSIYFLMEHVNGKNLGDRLKEGETYNPEQIKKIINGTLEGLSYMASKRIMHRDLKPQNILIDDKGNPKIIDFGLATFIDEKEYIFGSCGTAGYIAPEVFRYSGGGPKSYYNDKCDVFSVGCIFYYLLYGEKFFRQENNALLLEENRNYRCNNESFRKISQELLNPSSSISWKALEFLGRLLEFDPRRRPSAVKCLQLEYLSSNSNTKPYKKLPSDSDIRIKRIIQLEPLQKRKDLRPKETLNSNQNFTDNINANIQKDNNIVRRSTSSALNILDSFSKSQPNAPGSLKKFSQMSLPVKASKFSGKLSEDFEGDCEPLPSKSRRNSFRKITLIKENIKNNQITFTEAIQNYNRVIQPDNPLKVMRRKAT